MIQNTLEIVHICDMHGECGYYHRKVKNSTISHDNPYQPYGNVAINGIVSVYDKPCEQMVLKDAQAVFQ